MSRNREPENPTVGTVLPGWLTRLEAGLQDESSRHRAAALRPGIGARPAAVLALVGETEEGPDVLFIERALTLRTHPGQIAFPGGAVDAGDADRTATALREAVEETGLDPAGVVPLGSLAPAHVAVSGFDVTTVVAWWRTASPVSAADPLEVAAVHRVPVSRLIDPDLRVSVDHPSGYRGPGFMIDDLLIWGLTAHLLDGVLELAGWGRPWDDSRTTQIPARYLRDAGRGHGGPDAH